MLYDSEVVFKNDVRLLIQVVGCAEQTPYVQVVAVDKNGREIGSGCDTSDIGLGGRYQVGVTCANGAEKEYIVDVVRGTPTKKKRRS